MATTSIEWTDASWNPIIGCEMISPGCAHCYAETMAFRLRGMALADIAAGRGENVRDRNDAGFEGDTPTAWPMDTDFEELERGFQGAPVRIHLKDRKGGDMSEWPEDLRVREMPSQIPAGRG